LFALRLEIGNGMATASKRPTSQQQHRRETILYLIVPMIVTGVLVLAGGAAVILLPRRLQVSLVSDWMLSVFVLCPVVLCLFTICMLLMVAVAAMNRLHDIVTKPLDQIENVSQTMVEKTAQVTETINNKTVDMSSRFAFIDRFLSVFDVPEDEKK
jgi:hypothetical protein